MTTMNSILDTAQCITLKMNQFISVRFYLLYRWHRLHHCRIFPLDIGILCFDFGTVFIFFLVSLVRKGARTNECVMTVWYVVCLVINCTLPVPQILDSSLWIDNSVYAELVCDTHNTIFVFFFFFFLGPTRLQGRTMAAVAIVAVASPSAHGIV